MRPTRRSFLLTAGAAAAALARSSTWAQMNDYPANDPRSNAKYLDAQIKHISDADLFAAMDLDRPGLKDIRAAVARSDFPSAYSAWGKYWPTVSSRVKFTGPDGFLHDRDEAASLLQPDRTMILADADRLMHHKIKGWGEKVIQFGPVVDFNADFGKSGKYGFHYWGWARPLVSAFMLTNDQKYLAELDALFDSWYTQRDRVSGDWPGLDVIYYELGLGVRHRLFLEFYALPAMHRTTTTHERMLKSALGAARWLADEERISYREGNWQIIGSFGLAQIGLMLPEFKESANWIRLACQRMSEHLAHDFYPDGCHSERCPASYSIIAYRDPRNLAYLLSSHDELRGIAETIRKPLQRSIEWWMYLLPPDGILPGINDGSRAPMLTTILQDGHDLFGRDDTLYVKQKLLAPKSVQTAGIEPAHRSMHYPASGFTMMRSDWSADAHYLLINHGPYGGGHSHADALSFELHAFGRAMAIDSGIGETYDDPHQLTYYVHAPAHNMITFDGEDPDRRAAEGTMVLWKTDAHFDYFAATHHGYQSSKGIIHRRHIAFVKSGYFVIFDEIDATGATADHLAEWNLHATVPMKPDADGFASPNGPGLIVRCSATARSSQSKARASVRGIAGFDTPWANIDWLRLGQTIAAGTSIRFATLLLPFKDRAPGAHIDSIGPSEFRVRIGPRADRLRFSPAFEIVLESA